VPAKEDNRGVWTSAALVVGSAGRVLVVAATVGGALVATAGLYFQRQTRREQQRERAAEAVETTRNVIRDLQLLAREEAPDPAMIEEVRLRWVDRVRDELVKFTGSQRRQIRDRGSGLASDVDEALRLAKRSVASETEEERAAARAAFDQLVPKLYDTVRWLRGETSARTESARASE
jgi:gas vesicle protein